MEILKYLSEQKPEAFLYSQYKRQAIAMAIGKTKDEAENIAPDKLLEELRAQVDGGTLTTEKFIGGLEKLCTDKPEVFADGITPDITALVVQTKEFKNLRRESALCRSIGKELDGLKDALPIHAAANYQDYETIIANVNIKDKKTPLAALNTQSDKFTSCFDYIKSEKDLEHLAARIQSEPYTGGVGDYKAQSDYAMSKFNLISTSMDKDAEKYFDWALKKPMQVSGLGKHCKGEQAKAEHDAASTAFAFNLTTEALAGRYCKNKETAKELTEKTQILQDGLTAEQKAAQGSYKTEILKQSKKMVNLGTALCVAGMVCPPIALVSGAAIGVLQIATAFKDSLKTLKKDKNGKKDYFGAMGAAVKKVAPAIAMKYGAMAVGLGAALPLVSMGQTLYNESKKQNAEWKKEGKPTGMFKGCMEALKNRKVQVTLAVSALTALAIGGVGMAVGGCFDGNGSAGEGAAGGSGGNAAPVAHAAAVDSSAVMPDTGVAPTTVTIEVDADSTGGEGSGEGSEGGEGESGAESKEEDNTTETYGGENEGMSKEEIEGMKKQEAKEEQTEEEESKEEEKEIEKNATEEQKEEAKKTAQEIEKDADNVTGTARAELGDERVIYKGKEMTFKEYQENVNPNAAQINKEGWVCDEQGNFDKNAVGTADRKFMSDEAWRAHIAGKHANANVQESAPEPEIIDETPAEPVPAKAEEQPQEKLSTQKETKGFIQEQKGQPIGRVVDGHFVPDKDGSFMTKGPDGKVEYTVQINGHVARSVDEGAAYKMASDANYRAEMAKMGRIPAIKTDDGPSMEP
jgi:hypothetical protein